MDGNGKPQNKTFKWKIKGRLVSRGQSQSTREECTHPTVMKDMCAECGADLRHTPGQAGVRKEAVSASVAMVHSIPELIVSEQEALEIGKADQDRLLRTRKLVLLVDLDQTLVHTTNDNIPPNLKGVFHFELAHGNAILWYHTRLRPHTEQLLQKISQLYELHICTFGVRVYAHTIANFLDPEGKFFSHRILSRDECFSFNSKTANLKALFPCGDSMVCIIDDREDVWSFSPNLIHVKPYRFFQGTADINAPPGCDKTESDTSPIKHKVRRISHTSDGNSLVEEIESVGKEGETTDNPDCTEGNAEKTIPMTNSDAKDSTEDSSEKEVSENTAKEEDGILQSECVVLEKPGGDSEEKSEKDAKEESASDTDKGGSDKENENSGKPEYTESENESAKSDSDVQTISEEIEWVDDDDYLYHLEEILTRLHKAYYEVYDQMAQKGQVDKVPDMKSIIPYVKKKVLKGVNLLFSGVIPTNMPAEKSRAYIVAMSLGANIQNEFVSFADGGPIEATTHLVAARLGTSKVRAAQKSGVTCIVHPDWLWNCSERWERVDERLFPLTDGAKHSIPLNRSSPDNFNKIIHMRDMIKEGEKRKNEVPAEEVYVYDRVTGKRVVQNKRQKMADENNSAVPLDLRAGPLDLTAGPLNPIVPSKSDTETRIPDPSGDENVCDSNAVPAEGRENNFAQSYNPLYSFSDEDIANMDKEVEDLLDEEEDDGSSEEEDSKVEERKERELRMIVLGKSPSHESSSDEDSLTGDLPRGWKIKRKLQKLGKLVKVTGSSDKEENGEENVEDEEEDNNVVEVLDSDDDIPMSGRQPSDSDNSNDSIGSVDDEIALAVEKEFLS